MSETIDVTMLAKGDCLGAHCPNQPESNAETEGRDAIKYTVRRCVEVNGCVLAEGEVNA